MTHALDEWRPGFVRRANNFEDVCKAASTWQWSSEMTLWGLKDLVSMATPDLSDGERSVLAIYCCFLNLKECEKSRAFVWPSNRLLSILLRCSLASIRERRRGLEQKGYILRDYNRANRPAGREAIDLGPLFARYSDMLDLAGEAFAENEAHRLAWAQNVVDIQKYRTQAPESQHLEQSHLSEAESVQESAAPTARSNYGKRAKPATTTDTPSEDPNRTDIGSASAIGSPMRARAQRPAALGGSLAAKSVQEELQLAVQACPGLATALTPEVIARPSEAGAGVLAELERLASNLLPEPHRNNGQTMRWAWRVHGVRSAAILAVALADPDVKSPCGYFGALATTPASELQKLKPNLLRILKGRPSAGAAGQVEARAPVAIPDHWPKPPGSDDPTWLAIGRALRSMLSKGAYDTWFAPSVGFAGIKDGVLTLTAPQQVGLKIAEYREAVLAAAQLAGFEVERLWIANRRIFDR